MLLSTISHYITAGHICIPPPAPCYTLPFYGLYSDDASHCIPVCCGTGIVYRLFQPFPPLLLIHGAPGAWYGSRNFLEDSLLQQHYHIIAVDRPGYNKSRFRRKRKAVTSITLQAVGIREALRLNRSHKTGVVVGSSYGAPIAAKLAMLYPQHFHHLVMLAPAIDPDKEKFWWFHPYVRRGPVRWLLPRFINNATDEKLICTREGIASIVARLGENCHPGHCGAGRRRQYCRPGQSGLRPVATGWQAGLFYFPSRCGTSHPLAKC